MIIDKRLKSYSAVLNNWIPNSSRHLVILEAEVCEFKANVVTSSEFTPMEMVFESLNQDETEMQGVVFKEFNNIFLFSYKEKSQIYYFIKSQNRLLILEDKK